MTVKELSREEIDELKNNYFYDDSIENKLWGYDVPDEIPDKVIFDYYGAVSFTTEDFFCNL